MKKMLAVIASVAIVVSLIGYFGLSWFSDRAAFSIVMAILGGFVGFGFYWILQQRKEEALNPGYVVSVILGALAFLILAAPKVKPPSIDINCNSMKVTPSVGADHKEWVYWRVLSNASTQALIEFDGGFSPFRDAAGGQLPRMSIQAPGGINNPGRGKNLVAGDAMSYDYKYKVRCGETWIEANPMIQVPRP